MSVTTWDDLPDELSSWPTFAPPPAVLGQVELLIGFRDNDRVLTIDVPVDVAEAASDAGHLVLTDEEGTPLADVAVEKVSSGDDRESGRVAGPVSALRPFRTGPFVSLRRWPEEVRSELGKAPAVALVLSRPLTSDEENRIVAEAISLGARLLLLPCVADTGPSGLPPEVLVRAVQAALPRLRTPAGPALMVPLPLMPSATAAVPAEAAEFVRRTGASLIGSDVAPSRAGWDHIRSALDAEPGVLEDLVDRDVATVLRGWRPPRPERGLTVFFTGLSGSGKSTLARGLVDALRERGRSVTPIDGDVARRLLSFGLGYSRADRDLNIRRIGWVASEVTRHGGVAVCAPIAPFASIRSEVRRMVEEQGDFVLVYVATPLAVCEQRDHKGLYARARAGLLPGFTGVSDPYEEPADADLRIDTSLMPVEKGVHIIVGYLQEMGWLTPVTSSP
jgi:sulfate adenylyltransferase